MAAVGRFAPPLLFMGLIYFLSDQPHLATGLGFWDLLLRKVAHVTEYGILWWLWWRALGYRGAAVAVAVLITVLYAASDEWHQSFVQGRVGSVWDVAIDAAGVGLAGLAVVLRERRRGRAGERRQPAHART